MSKGSRLARTMAFPLFLYLIVLSSVGFGAGYCYGPRYWVAFLPWLALGTVEAIRRAGRYQRAICAVLVLFAIAIAIPGALRYPQLFRQTSSGCMARVLLAFFGHQVKCGWLVCVLCSRLWLPKLD